MAKGKKKGRVRIKQKARVRKKGEGRDSLKKAPTKVPNNGATLKVKLKRRND